MVVLTKLSWATAIAFLPFERRPAIEKFRKELDERMELAFTNVHKVAKKYKVDLRTAAFIVAVGRVSSAFSVRGSLV